MKKILILLFTAAIILSGCGSVEIVTAETPSPAAESSDAESDLTQADAETLEEPALIFADDLFDGYGYFHQRCDASGMYDFVAANSDGIKWEVYILDEEFTEAERYIPQAYTPSLEGEGSLYIEQGKWIYVYCPCNQWTGESAPEHCAFSWKLNPDV